MDFCGVICEFNPFHNGHLYFLSQVKKQTDSKIICLMSGNFVQRGEPAIEDKYNRAKKAIQAGAHAVYELPTIFACSNAENFAYGAIKILKALNVKQIAFGVTETDLETLQKIAQIKFDNSVEFQNCFKNEIENGINYNTALKRAIAKQIDSPNISKILACPNNILAIEYLTAILKLDAKISPIAIERIDNGYYSQKENGKYLSASSIREKLNNGEDVARFLPEFAGLNSFFDSNCMNKFQSIMLYKLRSTKAEELSKCYDYTEGIEYRIKRISDQYSNINDIVAGVTTPRFKSSRVNKLLLYPLLEITKTKVKMAAKTKPAIKLLAINKKEKQLLSTYNKKQISIIVTNDDYNSLTISQKKIADIDLAASNLYGVITNKQNNNDKKTGALFI